VKYIKDDALLDADSAEDAQQPTALYEARIAELQEKIATLPAGYDPLEKAEMQVAIGALYNELDAGMDAYNIAREAFDTAIEADAWEVAAQACNVMFNAEQPESLAALGQGIWLAVTFPEVDPELTVALLQNVIDETPDDSDGAALAGATAKFIVDLRCQGKQHDDLSFFVNQMLGNVARRHSNVENQEQFKFWVERMELDNPDVFLPRMRSVINVLVGPDWWIDTDEIQARIPDQ
jgi:hypothetical protein